MLGAMTSTLMGIPDGVAGVKATLVLMRKLARASKTALPVITQARVIVSGIAEKDYAGEAKALQSWVQANIRYVRDVNDVETLQRPEETLTLRSGDCDDKATLLAALGEAIGFPACFIAVGIRGGEFSHVLTKLLVPGMGWVSLETIPIDDRGTRAPFGWFPPDATSFMTMHV